MNRGTQMLTVLLFGAPLVAVPLAFLLPRLPIPLPSFGIEQGAFVYVAMRLGVSKEGAAAV